MFQQCGMTVEMVKSRDEMLKRLGIGEYDPVISDIARGPEPDAALQALQQLREQGYNIPVIFYIEVINLDRGVPPHAFGITNRPDELLQLTLDIVERRR